MTHAATTTKRDGDEKRNKMKDNHTHARHAAGTVGSLDLESAGCADDEARMAAAGAVLSEELDKDWELDDLYTEVADSLRLREGVFPGWPTGAELAMVVVWRDLDVSSRRRQDGKRRGKTRTEKRAKSKDKKKKTTTAIKKQMRL